MEKQDNELTAEGVKACGAGVPWWENPYPSGSRAAFVWDRGHTVARLRGDTVRRG